MKKINWKSVIGWGVLVVFIGCVLYFNQPQEKKDGELVVATNLPLTGPVAVIGEPYAKGIEMGVKDELKAQDLPENSVRLLMGDNQGQAMTAATLFRQQELNDYDVYIAGATDPVYAIMNEVKADKPLFTLALDEDITVKRPNNIRILINSALSRNKVYEFIKAKNPKKVAIIAGCTSCQKFANTVVIPYLKKHNIDYYMESFEFGYKEFRTTALKIKQYNPDIILAKAYPAELLRTITTLKEYGLINNDNTWTSIDFIDFFDMGEDMKKMNNVIFDATEYNLSSNAAFEKEYQERYNKKPNFWAAYGYDTGRLIVKAWVKSGQATPESIIAQTPYDGVTGHLVMDPKTRDLISTQILGTLDENGHVVEWKPEGQ